MRVVLAVLLAAASFLPTGPFVLDGARSRVEFHVRDNRGGFTGVAPDVDARVVVREHDAGFTAEVDVRIDARTLTTGNGVRDRQMRRDFLLTDRFPAITFRGTVDAPPAPPALAFSAVLRGEVTIKDVTREIEIPLRVTAPGDRYLADGQVVLRMSEFRIPRPRFLIFVAEDPVEVTLHLSLIPR